MPAAAAAPKVTPAQAVKAIRKAAKPKKTPQQRNSKFATKQYAKRQQIKVATVKQVNSSNTRSRGAQAKQRVRARQQVAASNVQAQRQISGTRVAANRQNAATKVLAARQISADKSADYLARRMAAQDMYAAKDRRRAVKQRTIRGVSGLAEQKSLGKAAGTIASPAQPMVNPLLLILFTWAGIIILYTMITQPTHTSAFMNSLKSWVSLLYSTKPMFTVKES